MTGVVLLTGATGFVGRQILRGLVDRGIPCRVVVRRGTAGRLAPIMSRQVEIAESDDLFAESPQRLEHIVSGMDTMIHAAWYAEPGRYLTSPRNLDCLRGTLELARAFVVAGGRRFVGVGTCFEYDLTAGHLDIDTPLRPATPYAACKAAAFLALSTHMAEASIEFAWCRLFYLHGEGEAPGRLVPYLRERLAAGKPAELTSGRQVRDYLDVREAADRIVDVATGGVTGPVNICSGVPVTVREIAERIADEHDARHLLRWGARADNLTDPPVVVGVPATV